MLQRLVPEVAEALPVLLVRNVAPGIALGEDRGAARGTPNRRAVQVELTRAGHALHARLLKTVIGFNRQLRSGLGEDDVETLRSLLARLQKNVLPGQGDQAA